MGNAELDRARLRVRELRTEMQRELRTGGAAPPCAEERFGCRFAPGARVFDLVSGEEAIVVAGTIENVVVPVAGRRAG